MPQLVVVALLGAGLYAGYRLVMRTKDLVADLRRAETEASRGSAGALEKDMGPLELDPTTGVYRPAKRG